MSYRGFTRLLGETSLERKCRVILGAGMFVLVLASFIFYEWQTEKLVREQVRVKSHLLAWMTVLTRHLPAEDDPASTPAPSSPNPAVSGKPSEAGPAPGGASAAAPNADASKPGTSTDAAKPGTVPGQDAHRNPAETPKAAGKRSEATPTSTSLKPDAVRPERSRPGVPPTRGINELFAPATDVQRAIFGDVKATTRVLRDPQLKTVGAKVVPTAYAARLSEEIEALKRLREGGVDTWEVTDRRSRRYYYWETIRLREDCMKCHPSALDRKLEYPDLKLGDPVAIVSVDLNYADTELAINVNRAVLLSFAIGTAILAVAFTYITIRYVVVKPVSHLQQVSDEIAAGNLAIRSSIRTGDEFQELSQAFNRMIRSLVSMQDELSRVNVDLDRRLDELARVNMTLFEMNRMKSEFLAKISHELRTPLNSVMGFSDLLAQQHGMDPRQLKWIGNIQSGGKMLLQLVNDILDLAKLEAGKMQVEPEEFGLRLVVDELMAMMKPIADRKNIELSADADPLLSNLRQDRRKLTQILQNLTSNAIKFTPEGGSVRITARADRAHVILSVRDTGVGIAPEDQKLIFEKFRQAERTLTREHGGTGLGLSIVREMVKLLGGDEVRLESELGRGSVFTVRLPMIWTPQPGLELGPEEEVFVADAAQTSGSRTWSITRPPIDG
jgi:signal transduction histidine kinase